MIAMRQIVKVVVVLVLVALVATPLMAQEKGKKRGKRPPKQDGTEAQLMTKLKQLDLTTEQKDKIKTILASYKPKLEKVAGTLKVTPEQRSAAAEARKAAQAEGKKGKDLQKAVSEALNLSDDQKASREEQQKLNRQLHKEITEVLTAEQREKFDLKKHDAAPKKKQQQK
jgi:Spy/CpxP family protein refolding chaperone